VRLAESSNWLLQVGANLHAEGPGVDRAAAAETKTRIAALARPVKARGGVGMKGSLAGPRNVQRFWGNSTNHQKMTIVSCDNIMNLACLVAR
jgi:hypothetical protein